MEKPAEAGGAPLGGRLNLCVGDTRIRRAIIIIDIEKYLQDFWLTLISRKTHLLREPSLRNEELTRYQVGDWKRKSKDLTKFSNITFLSRLNARPPIYEQQINSFTRTTAFTCSYNPQDV